MRSGGDRQRVQQRDVGGDVIERKLQEDISGNCPSHPMCDKIKADSGSVVVMLQPLLKPHFCGGGVGWGCVRGQVSICCSLLLYISSLLPLFSSLH